MSRVEVDVTLPPGWLPVGPLPGLLLAAVAPGDDSTALATLVVRMEHVPALREQADAETVLRAIRAGTTVAETATAVREVRWCAPATVAVLAATAAPGADVTRDDLAAALRQTAVYAVDSCGSAIRPSSAGDADDGCRGSTRTV